MDTLAHALWAGLGLVAARRRVPIAPGVATAAVGLAVLPDLAHLVPLLAGGGWRTLLDYIVATPGTERHWLELATRLDMRALEREVARAREPRADTEAAAKRQTEHTERPARIEWTTPNRVRVTWELEAEAWALITLQVCLAAMNIRGVKKNDDPQKAEVERSGA